MSRPPRNARQLGGILGGASEFGSVAAVLQKAVDEGTVSSVDFAKYKNLSAEQIALAQRAQMFARTFNDLDSIGNRPADLSAKEVVFRDAENQEHALPAGFYLVTGSTGAGKSINMAALLSWIYVTQALDGSGLPAIRKLVQYSYLYEARGPQFSEEELAPDKFLANVREAFGIEATTRPMKEGVGVYAADAFKSRLRLDAFASAVANDKATTRVWVVDSISLPLRAHSRGTDKATAGRKGEATMAGGLQPSDVDFVVAMEAIALDLNIAILGIINTDLVPFSDKLEGVTEGLISVEGPGVFRYRQRSDRKTTFARLPRRALDMGAEFLHYPPEQVSDIFDLVGYIAN